MTEMNPFVELEQERLRRQARGILSKDDVQRGNIDLGPATAQAVIETPEAQSHTGEWEQMSRTEQAMNALGVGQMPMNGGMGMNMGYGQQPMGQPGYQQGYAQQQAGYFFHLHPSMHRISAPWLPR